MKGKQADLEILRRESLGENSASSLIRLAFHVRSFNQVLILSCCRNEFIKVGVWGWGARIYFLLEAFPD